MRARSIQRVSEPRAWEHRSMVQRTCSYAAVLQQTHKCNTQDDFIIRLTPKGDSATTVDMRSRFVSCVCTQRSSICVTPGSCPVRVLSSPVL